MKTAVILEGIFDPPTMEAVKEARRILTEGKTDVVILKPLDGERMAQRRKLVSILVQPYRRILVYDRQKIRHYRIISLLKYEYSISVSEGWSALTRKMKRYIMDQGLYQHELAFATVKGNRAAHMEKVAELAQQLAPYCGLDPRKAYTAGLFHDIAKQLDDETLEMYMDLFYPSYKSLPRALWHQFAGEIYLIRHFKMTDRAVLKAVRHHATGDSSDPLCMLIYAADKLDPGRGYDSAETIELCRQDLAAGFREVHRQQNEYLKKEGLL